MFGRIAPKNHDLLKAIISLPNTPDIQPEVVGLYVRYGELRIGEVLLEIKEARKKAGVDHDTFQEAILTSSFMKPSHQEETSIQGTS